MILHKIVVKKEKMEGTIWVPVLCRKGDNIRLFVETVKSWGDGWVVKEVLESASSEDVTGKVYLKVEIV
jgi:hypothetical protein